MYYLVILIDSMKYLNDRITMKLISYQCTGFEVNSTLTNSPIFVDGTMYFQKAVDWHMMGISFYI